VAPAILLLAACGGRGAIPNGSGGSVGGAGVGAGGRGAGGAEAACTGSADPRLVVAPQRILLLTMPQVVSTVGYLLGPAAAEQVRSSPGVALVPESDRRFPPGDDGSISDVAVTYRDRVGQIVGEYVLENFAEVTKCAPATDVCALDFLNAIAARAYRREPTTDERTALRDLYSTLREQQVNGYQVTATVEEATQYALYALMTSPQLLWRYEVGDQAAALASSPSGVSLTDDELASAVSFFLTDRPPDDELRAAARAGTLRTTLASHVARILDTEAARTWLRSVMEIYFGQNRLPQVEAGNFPGLTTALLADMQNEWRLFLAEALWRGDLSGLLVSRTAFLNSRLATSIYDVPVPSGATDAAFVKTTLPSDRRAGLLTNAGFLTVNASSDGGTRVAARGRQAAAALLCAVASPVPFPGPVSEEEATQSQQLDATTAQQQVTARRKPACLECHATMDAVGVVLDAYDGIGRYRTVDDRGQPVDTHAFLPPVLGNGTVDGAAAMAEAIARSPAFVACMARVVLQHAMTDTSAWVEAPLTSQRPGCATADVAARFSAGSDKTFGALVRAAAASPAFVLRSPAP